jgi:hypothetical protein
MATYSWLNPASADWNTAADWAGGGIPNGATADVVIDAGSSANTAPYTVLISSTETVTINSLTMNAVNNIDNLGATYTGAILEVDGTLQFAPGSTGAVNGPLQSQLIVDNGHIINAGTVNAFVLGEGSVTFTGTNGIYFTNWLESVGTVTVDTSSIAEYTPGTRTLFDGIWEARGTGDIINLGGAGGGLVVNVATLQGPGIDYSPGLPGWTQLIFEGDGSAINEWNGTTYVPIESTISLIQNNATIDVFNDPVSNAPRDYTTTNALTIGSGGLFDQQAGTLTTGGLTIASGGTLTGAPVVVGNVVNNGQVIATGGDMVMQGSITGTGTLTFGTTPGTLTVQGVAAGQTVALKGGDTLILGSPTAFKGTLSDTGNNSVVLTGLIATSAVLSGGTLDIMNGTSLVDTILVSGSAPAVGVTSSGGNSILAFGATPPVITAGASASYTAGGNPVPLDAALTVTDANSTTLAGATVTISSGFRAGDTLAVATEAGITSSYDAGTGVLTLSGTASLATYQAALDSVTYAYGSGDPTNSGADLTRTITWAVNDGSATAAATSSLAVSAATSNQPVPNDFTGGGASDLLLTDGNGNVGIAAVQNGVAAVPTQLGGLSSGWSVLGTARLFGGGTSDILFQNTNGAIAQWQMQNGQVIGATLVGASSGDWSYVGAGDLFGTGTDDLVFRNSSGTYAEWTMQNGQVTGATVVGATGNDWIFAGIANLSGSGNTDNILFTNSSGALADWTIQNGVAVSANLIGQTSSYWAYAGVGDFMGNGQNDILFRGQGGEIAMWTMQNGAVTGAAVLGVTSSDWQIAGIGDYGHTGTDDILFRNTNGSLAMWQVSQGQVTGAVGLGGNVSGWNLAPAA